MKETGLEPEFVTGSHAVRFSGSWLEDQRWWIRLNHIWGGLFPSLGSECYVCGRRLGNWVSQTGLVKTADAHWRALWASLTAAAALVMLTVAWNVWQTWSHQDSRQLISWIETHQEGSDHFIVSHDDSEETLSRRADVRTAEGLSDALYLLKNLPHAHMLVTESDLETLCHWEVGHKLVIDSRLPRIFQDDLILLRYGTTGTPLRSYLFTCKLSVQAGSRASGDSG